MDSSYDPPGIVLSNSCANGAEAFPYQSSKARLAFPVRPTHLRQSKLQFLQDEHAMVHLTKNCYPEIIFSLVERRNARALAIVGSF
jgi:hypothetical protein